MADIVRWKLGPRTISRPLEAEVIHREVPQWILWVLGTLVSIAAASIGFAISVAGRLSGLEVGYHEMNKRNEAQDAILSEVVKYRREDATELRRELGMIRSELSAHSASTNGRR
jgi:hypothetical protein